MAIRNIVLEGDDILRKKAKTVTEINDKIRMILDDMLETMREHNGVGIAANQIGLLKRMFVIEIDEEVIELINPEIIQTSGIQCDEEGCLSQPDIAKRIQRPNYVKIKGLNRYGAPVEYEGSGLLARAFCHEYDHLEGILFTDHPEAPEEEA